jgi:hypothetical protein
MEVGQGPNWGCSAKEKKYSAPETQEQTASPLKDKAINAV